MNYPKNFPYTKWSIAAIVLISLSIMVFMLTKTDNAIETPFSAANPTKDSEQLPYSPLQSNINTHHNPAAVNLAYKAALGPTSALVTIIEYGSYGCTVCRRIYQSGIIDKMLVRYPRDIRYIYLGWPVMIQPNDQMATEALYCATDQGDYYWVYNSALFELSFQEYDQYNRIEPFVELAADLGLDAEQFKDCLTQTKYRQYVFDLIDAGMAMGLEATPTFFVNGKQISADRLEESVMALILEKRPDLWDDIER